MERSTWLKTSNSPEAPSPATAITSTAGMMARARVTRRRSHGRSRMFTNPSITIWPASVPVIVELWPAQMRATAKTNGATPLPTRGARSLWASWIDATSVWPDRKKTAAAITRMAALMKKAMFRATTESMVLYLRDWWIPSAVFTTLRDWTRAE